MNDEEILLWKAMAWKVTSHARTAMLRRDMDVREVMLTAIEPQQTYADSQYNPRSRVHQRGDLAVVVDPHDKVIITVLLRSGEQWTDADARGRKR
jgi:hypothetical protein